jgi:hypothetical protein
MPTWSQINQIAAQHQNKYIKQKNDQTIPFPDNKIPPTNQITHIVSLFIDTEIYDSLSDDIERYATQYIQKKLPRTKVLVIPLDRTATNPQDIALINDNLYHDWIKGKSSRLVGTIVIGWFQLPTVWNKEKFITSVYPRVDFEDIQFARNQSGQRFEYTENTKWQAEIRHGIIDYDINIKDYKFFFQKLRKYYEDPLAYVSRRIWVDDFVKLKKSYDSSKLLGYINNFLYAEDLSYHRFAPILASLMQTWQSIYDSQVTADYIDPPQFDLGAIARSDELWKLYQYNFAFLRSMTALSGKFPKPMPLKPEFVSPANEDDMDSREEFDKENDRIKEIIADSKKDNEKLLWSPDTKMFRPNTIPTKFLGVSILKYVYPYHTLFADSYLNDIYENTDAGGRYLNSKLGAWEVDTHIRYTSVKDQVSIQTIRDLNDVMEQALDRKIEKEKYMMNIPLLDFVKVYKQCPVWKCTFDPILLFKNQVRWYEQFFFGRNAMDIIQASETTIFRWSFTNVATLDKAFKLPIYGKILWWWYNTVTATQTACHLGYNFQKDFVDADYEESKYCGKKKKKVRRYRKYTWWNMTPHNIDQNETSQISLLEPNIDLMLAWNPSFDKSMGRPQFDLVGCKATNGDMIFGHTDDIHDGYDQWQRVPFSYSGYSDSYLASQYFWSLTRTQHSIVCNLDNVNICKPEQKEIHPDDLPQLYSGDLFTLVEKILPDTKSQGGQIWMRVHAKKWFKTQFMEWWFFYHTPIVEQNQPVYITHNSSNVLLGIVKFPGLTWWYSGDVYPTGTPVFKPSPVQNLLPLIPDSWDKTIKNALETAFNLAESLIGTSLPLQSGEVLWSNPYMTLTGGDSCEIPLTHKKLYQHFYKTIDSRIYHKSPTDGEITQMNTTTLARPIDDPRYISFKGIAWSTVRLLYPNLYEMPIQWDISIESLKKSLETYLQNKAQEHQKILKAELALHMDEYAKHQEVYDFLTQVDTIATPLVSGDRTYQIFDTDFYLRALGSTGLTKAAENIYYQLRNRPGYTNQTFTTVGAQIDWMKKNFNFNKKIEYIVWWYLTHDPKEKEPWVNKIRKTIIGINDGYRQQGYEVAVINSDGDDHILTANPLASQYPKGVNRETLNNKEGAAWASEVLDIKNENKTGNNLDGSSQIPTGAVAHDVLCWDQKYGSVVSLSKWPNALKCWLEETFKSPIALTVDFKSAKWPVVNNEIHIPYTKNTQVWDFWQMTDKLWKLAWTWWMEISNPWKQYVWREHENQVWLLKANPQEKDFGLFVDRDTILSSLKTIVDLTDEAFSWDIPGSILQLGSRGNISPYGELQIRLYSTGDTCLRFFDQSKCQTYEMTHDFSKPLNIPFKLWTTHVGNTIIDVGVCLNDTICYYKTMSIEVTSSEVDYVHFETPAKILTLWYQTPLIVTAYDKYNNKIIHTPHQYRLIVHGASILQGKEVFSNFNDALYLLVPHSPIKLALQRDMNDALKIGTNIRSRYKTVWQTSLWVKTPQIKLDFHPLSISRLWSIPGNEYQYLIIRGIPWAFVEVESLGGLWIPGVFKVSTWVATPAFVENKEFEIKNELIVPLKPTYKAGWDQIRVRMKYDDGTFLEKSIGTFVWPSFPYKINLNHDHVVVPWWSIITWEVTITDMYGNISNTPVDVFTTTQIPLCIPDQCPQAIEQDGITFGTSTIRGIGNIVLHTYQWPKDGMWWQGIAQMKMLGFPSKEKVISTAYMWDQKPAEQVTLNIQEQGWEQTNTALTVEYKGIKSETLRPIKNLNVMYLTLMGSGWSHYHRTLFKNSNKLLSLTTMVWTGDIIDMTYKSIQDSKDTKLNIGFVDSFKHITEFSQWHIVWESTKSFASYRLINYGDPVLTRIDNNRMVAGTPYDASIGKYIHSYPWDIVKNIDDIDFDNDGLEDIVVTMTDGVVRLLKNYLNHPTPGAPWQYHDMGMIGRIGDGLLETKVNPDGFFLRSQNGKIRKYPLGWGRMWIDWSLVCLDIPWWPELSPLYRVPQVHFVDLDLKWGTDILTSDYMWRIVATYSNAAFNPIETPVQDVTPFLWPETYTWMVLPRKVVSQTGGLVSVIENKRKPYRYKIMIVHPDPLQEIENNIIYIKDLGSLIHTQKLKYILDISEEWRRTSVLFTWGTYYADSFDDIEGIQPVFEDLPYTPDTSVWHSYLSSSKFYCDRGWKYRQYQGNNRIVVEEAELTLFSGNDHSLVVSVEPDPQEDLHQADVTVYQEKYASLMKYPSKTDKNTLFTPNLEDHQTKIPLVEGPNTKIWYTIPSPLPGDTRYYCPISVVPYCYAWVSKSLSWTTKPWEYVDITVRFWSSVARYIEHLGGPWKVLREADGKPLNYRSHQQTGTMIPYFDDLPEWYVMYIDNIQAGQWFSYTVQYMWADLYNIVPEYLNCDSYPDLKVAGHNGCNKNFNYYLNQWNSRVKKSFDLADYIIEKQTAENIITNKLLSGFYTDSAQSIKEGQTTQSTLSENNMGEIFQQPLTMIEQEYENNSIDSNIPIYIPTYIPQTFISPLSWNVSDTGVIQSPVLPNQNSLTDSLFSGNLWYSVWVQSVWNILNKFLLPSSVFAQDAQKPPFSQAIEATKRYIETANQWTNYGSINLNLDLSRQTTQKIQKWVDKVLKDLCNGFQVWPWWTCPKPFQMPFNMAFLAPGTYNLLGKKLMEDKWLPVFFFPGTLYAPAPIPIPYGLKSPSDSFYRADGGSIPSFIRFYIAPTLTLGLGLGLCFGIDKPLRQWLKKPFKDIVGNCIAMAIDLRPQCNKDAWWIPSFDDSMGAHSYPISPQRSSTYIVPTRRLDLLACPSCDNDSPKDQPILHIESSDGDLYQQRNHVNESLDDNDERPPKSQKSDSETEKYHSQSAIDRIMKLSQSANAFINGVATNNDIIEKQTIKTEKVKEYSNQIKWWGSVWLMPAIQRWIEEQIEYLINNAFHLDIKIYTPDLGMLTDGFKEVWDALWSEKGTAASVKSAISDYPSLKDDTGLWFSWLGWEKLSRRLSDYSWNPFDTLAQAFEHVSLFKFEQKDIQLKLPMIYSEDIAKYTAYLQGWLVNQQKIAQEREDAVQTCKSWKWFQKLANCDLIQTRATKIKASLVQIERLVRKNISTLEYYRSMPSQLTQYLNVYERYLAEVTETYGGLVTTVTTWMRENALRFEKRVEAIILLVWIIKTWQIIPDFSLNRSEKCSKCTIDTYSYLSEDRWSLAPSLPILPIPPFRIPDIILDLSKINIWITITLPHFTIVPTRVPLPQLPDLPSPLVVDLSAPHVSLPIPQLFELPQLQLPPFELPSFVPHIKLDLPMLPPAVKIPKINPGIRTIVKLIEFLGNLVCIYKRGFGLVWENSLKTKIEQMTQRNVDIFPFDALIDLAPVSPLKWYDIRVDTFVNFAFNFEWVYDVFKSMADTINKASNNFTSSVSHLVNYTDQWTNYYNDRMQTISSNLQFNYHYKDVDYEVVKEEFVNDLNQSAWILPQDLQDQLTSIKNIVTKDRVIWFNTSWFSQAVAQWYALLHNKRQEIAYLKQQIQENYQQFVTEQPRHQFVNTKTAQIFDFKLLNTDRDTLDTLKMMQDPDKIFLDINHRYIKVLSDMIDHVTPEQLGRDTLTHSKTTKLLNDLNYGIERANKRYRHPSGKHINPNLLLAQLDAQPGVQDNPVSDTNTWPQNPWNFGQSPNQQSSTTSDVDNDSNDEDLPSDQELAGLNQWTSPKPFEPVSSEWASSIGNYADPTSQIQWYFAPVGPVCKKDPFFGPCTKTNVCTEDRINIIDLPGKNLELYKSQPHHLASRDSALHLYDQHSVFAKTALPEYENDLIFDDFYELPSSDSLQDLAEQTQDGYILVDGDRYKVVDKHFHIHDFQAKGQDYESISFQRSHQWYSGYVVRVTDRVDIFPDRLLDNKKDPWDDGDFSEGVKYIVVLPYDTDLDTVSLSVVGEFENQTLESLKSRNVLLGIKYFRPQDTVLSVMLKNLPAKRYYTQVRGFNMQKQGLLSSLLTPFKQSKDYKTITPRSIQQMWGMQIVSDNEPPVWTFNLVRKKTGVIEGTGLMLDGVIMTHYKMVWTWDDNTKVMYSWINYQGELIKKVPGNRIEIDDLYFTWGFNETFEFGAMDSAGMVTVERIVLDVMIPDIEITSIKNYDNKYADVVAEITRDMDEGSVKFERLRNVLWTSLKDVDGRDLYHLVPGQTIVTGWLYNLDKSYDLLDTSGNVITSIDPQYPNLSLPESQQDTYEIDTSIQGGKIGLNIQDKNNGQTIFTYHPVCQGLSSHNPIQISNPQYQAIPLKDTSNPQLNGGTCIAQVWGECQILIDNKGNPLIPPPYNQTLDCIYTPGSSWQANYQFLDPNNQPIANISVVLKPLD